MLMLLLPTASLYQYAHSRQRCRGQSNRRWTTSIRRNVNSLLCHRVNSGNSAPACPASAGLMAGSIWKIFCGPRRCPVRTSPTAPNRERIFHGRGNPPASRQLAHPPSRLIPLHKRLRVRRCLAPFRWLAYREHLRGSADAFIDRAM